MKLITILLIAIIISCNPQFNGYKGTDFDMFTFYYLNEDYKKIIEINKYAETESDSAYLALSYLYTCDSLNFIKYFNSFDSTSGYFYLLKYFYYNQYYFILYSDLRQIILKAYQKLPESYIVRLTYRHELIKNFIEFPHKNDFEFLEEINLKMNAMWKNYHKYKVQLLIYIPNHAYEYYRDVTEYISEHEFIITQEEAIKYRIKALDILNISDLTDEDMISLWNQLFKDYVKNYGKISSDMIRYLTRNDKITYCEIYNNSYLNNCSPINNHHNYFLVKSYCFLTEGNCKSFSSAFKIYEKKFMSARSNDKLKNEYSLTSIDLFLISIYMLCKEDYKNYLNLNNVSCISEDEIKVLTNNLSEEIKLKIYETFNKIPQEYICN